MSVYLPALYQERIRTHIPDSNHTVSAGQNLTLSCNASFFTYRQWIRNQGINSSLVAVSDTSDGRISITPDFQLHFRGILLEDADLYMCSLRNDLGTDTITANIQVVGMWVKVYTLDFSCIDCSNGGNCLYPDGNFSCPTNWSGNRCQLGNYNLKQVD